MDGTISGEGHDPEDAGCKGAKQQSKHRKHTHKCSCHPSLRANFVAGCVKNTTHKVNAAENEGRNGPDEAKSAHAKHHKCYLFKEVFVRALVQLKLNPLLVREQVAIKSVSVVWKAPFWRVFAKSSLMLFSIFCLESFGREKLFSLGGSHHPNNHT